MENLKLILENYLKRDKNKSNYALLLNGKWGVGKTYYFQNNEDIRKVLENSNRKQIYVSLNGVKSIDEIEKQISIEMLKHRLDFNLKTIKAFNWREWLIIVFLVAIVILIGFGLYFAYKAANIMISSTLLASCYALVKVVHKFVSPLFTVSVQRSVLHKCLKVSYVYCFDDLERCAMPIKEVLGYINTYFIENKQDKVIIIANEEEIEKTIDKDKASYEIIKEKVIGRTVLFEPNQREIIDVITGKNKEEKDRSKHEKVLNSLRDFIDEKINWISDNKVWNLRTLFFAFEILEDTIDLMDLFPKKNVYDEFKNQFYKEIIIYTLCLAYEYKENNKNFLYLTDKNTQITVDAELIKNAPDSIKKIQRFQKGASFRNAYLVNDTINAGKNDFTHKYFDFITNFDKISYPKNRLLPIYDNIVSLIKNGYTNKSYEIICTAFEQALVLLVKDTLAQLIGYTYSEEDIIKSILFLDMLSKLDNAFDKWYYPIAYILAIKKFQNKGYISDKALVELIGDKNKDIVVWYFEQDYFKNFYQKHSHLKFTVSTKKEEDDEAIQKFLLSSSEYDKLILSNDYLIKAREFLQNPNNFKQDNCSYITKEQLKIILNTPPNNFSDIHKYSSNTALSLCDKILECENWEALSIYLKKICGNPNSNEKLPTLNEKNSLIQELIALKTETVDKLQLEKVDEMRNAVESWKIE